ncbi:hypothetical protein MKW94_018523, partial [Papaver nudicaule]|nr:hypothetical protein [Papaver nudicaule]
MLITFVILAVEDHIELFDAAYTGKLNRFKKAIRKAKDVKGRVSLHAAAGGGSLEVCRYLIEKLKLDVDSKDKDGCTPLYYTVPKGHLDTVRYLLEKGAAADASNHLNHTPLHYAARMGVTKIITLLLSRGVRVDVPTVTGTALQFAAGNGHRDAVKVLLAHGANSNVVHNQGTVSPLISAISIKSWECVELLLQAGADPNAVSYDGYDGNTPLTVAARDGRVDDIKRLLEAGADPNYKTN